MGLWTDDMTTNHFPADNNGVTGSGRYHLADGPPNFTWDSPGISVTDHTSGCEWWDPNDHGDTIINIQVAILGDGGKPASVAIGLIDPILFEGVFAQLSYGSVGTNWTLHQQVSASGAPGFSNDQFIPDTDIPVPFTLQLQFDPTTGDITTTAFEGSSQYGFNHTQIVNPTLLSSFIADAHTTPHYPLVWITKRGVDVRVGEFDYNIEMSVPVGGGGGGNGGGGGVSGSGDGSTTVPQPFGASAVHPGDQDLGIIRQH